MSSCDTRNNGACETASRCRNCSNSSSARSASASLSRNAQASRRSCSALEALTLSSSMRWPLSSSWDLTWPRLFCNDVAACSFSCKVFFQVPFSASRSSTFLCTSSSFFSFAWSWACALAADFLAMAKSAALASASARSFSSAARRRLSCSNSKLSEMPALASVLGSILDVTVFSPELFSFSAPDLRRPLVLDARGAGEGFATTFATFSTDTCASS
mmetsp:Transcript_103522/g.221370  ORF Transcript_103522/g.221370 Transcript_103522/m.221370 type:complete len:216 (-) Transcript_103522:281-928(-)